MDAEVARLVRTHGLTEEAAGAVASLFERRLANATLVFGDDGDRDATDAAGSATRYEELGTLGEGAMGAVLRVRDRQLKRTLAMKVTHAELVARPAALTRFIEEAQATAQLQHPNIVPVYDAGRLPDGRVWFTMLQIRGNSLEDAIDRLHDGEAEWTLRRVVAILHAVANAVGFAHDRGVLHRDLKPANVMVGDRGEVYVVDWGLAKILGSKADREDVVATDRSESGAQTRVGLIAGTPAYMPPEQAIGAIDQLDARSDVYALGAVLYQLLCGRPPFRGEAQAVIEAVRAGPPAPVTSWTDLPFVPPPDLVLLVEQAMARQKDARFPDGAAFAEALGDWLDGAGRVERAREMTARALQDAAEVERLEAHSAALIAEAAAALARTAPWDGEERKERGWSLLAEADAAGVAAEARDAEIDLILQAALREAPDLPEAHAALFQRLKARHKAAEARRDRRTAARLEPLLLAHAAGLPPAHPERLAAARYLTGTGTLTLDSAPSGARVSMEGYVERNRRLVPVSLGDLGVTPLDGVRLERGSYVCTISHPDGETVRLPIHLERQHHEDRIAPGEQAGRPVVLPPRGSIGPDEVVVSAGWTPIGGDPAHPDRPAVRMWIEGFVMHRLPVTNRQYLAFLDDLVAAGMGDEAQSHAPRERAGPTGERGALIYGFDGERFSLQPDPDGVVWKLDWPVIQVDWFGACAYLDWLAAHTGLRWRLPTAAEWERAARGVDGRYYPWGDHLDPSWCRMVESAQGRVHGDYGPVAVGIHPVDTSPFGVQDLAGNVEDWCADVVDGGMRAVRGGSWSTSRHYARCAAQSAYEAQNRVPSRGFRGVRSL